MKLVVVGTALLTTFSTTGYLLLFIIGLSVVVFEYGRRNYILIIPVAVLMIALGYFIYTQTDFLKEKIEGQIDKGNKREGEFNPSRYGAFLFDLYYIKKHTLIGNGIHEKTRFKDHPWLWGITLGHGNGFSNFLASMGFFGLIVYSYYIFKWKKQYGLYFLGFIFLMLQGENMMIFPVFLSIPFIIIFDEKNSSFNYLL